MNALQAYGFRSAQQKMDEAARLLKALDARGHREEVPLQSLILSAAEHRVASDFPQLHEASQRYAEQLGRPATPGCIYIQHRALTAGVASAGGYLKGLEVPGVFGESGLDPDLADELGVEKVPMQGDGAFAKMSTGFTTAWLANETSQISESTPVIGSVASTPKRVGGYFEISRQLLMQTSPAASALIVRELVRQVRHAIVVALFNGSGAGGQPTGIINTSGVGNQSGTSLAWAGIIEMMRLCEATGPLTATRGVFLLDPASAKLMRTRERATGAGLILNDDKIGPYRAIVTNTMPASSVLFGDWSQVVVPTWGVLEIGADPYMANGGAGFRAGIVGVRCFAHVDVAVLRPGGFAKSTSVT
jgi:HK97 family phage major capsid protein